MIKAILFDLDGTLYGSTEVRKKFAEAAYHTLAKMKNISVEDAERLIEETRENLRKEHGFPVPYTLTLIRFHIPVETWHEENIKFFDPRDYLIKDVKLKKFLTTLKKNYCLAILTNNNNVQAERILEALGLDDVFSKVFTYNSFKTMKPNPEFFQKAINELNVRLEECLVVGDRYNVDLIPAKDLGMQIYEVKGPEDIYNLKIQ